MKMNKIMKMNTTYQFSVMGKGASNGSDRYFHIILEISKWNSTEYIGLFLKNRSTACAN